MESISNFFSALNTPDGLSRNEVERLALTLVNAG